MINESDRAAATKVVSAGVLLGAGLGGFLDGIVLHQLLQWHNMLSSVRPPVDLVSMKYNMLWDGIFHAATWVMTVAGLARLWGAMANNRAAESGRVLIGGLLIGWGAFNFVEGVIDHLVLEIHHVHPGEDELAWDLGFLGLGLVLAAIGLFLVRSTARNAVRGG